MPEWSFPSLDGGSQVSSADFAGRQVTGLTTAASLLMVAIIGIAAGLHFYVLAPAATGLTLLVLFVLSRLEGRFPRRGDDVSGGAA